VPSSRSTFSITTAIPYVNAKPHLGHVLEWFQADAVARYQRDILGKDVWFGAGTDENSLKNVQAAEKAGKSTQDWLDEYAVIFEEAYKNFGIELTGFRRGSDQKLHWPGVQELWRRCVASGDMYKKTYQGLYCVGCESFYTADELIDGKCPEHLVPPEVVEEENYFFRLSKYQDQILQLIERGQLNIVSEQFRNEMLSFVRRGLEDFSVSRSTQRARGIGVPVPDDESQVMYVWFDALAIYMTAMGWGYDAELFQKYWPADVHVIGKGINRFHSVYWIGMLLSSGLPTPKTVCIHGYITADGQKMSKSLGNVIDPFELVKKYTLESVRYYLLKEIPTHSDGDFSYSRFAELYTADLANGLGNLCSRVAKLTSAGGHTFTPVAQEELLNNPAFFEAMNQYELSTAAHILQHDISKIDQQLNQDTPWKLTGSEQQASLAKAVTAIQKVSFLLQPFMPQTAKQIFDHFNKKQIEVMKPLFPRLVEE
jgi:methionyl-tRNA synthetase